MDGVRSDSTVFQYQQSATLATTFQYQLTKNWLNQQVLQKALNITTIAPKSIVSEITRCLRCTKPMLLAIRAALVSGNHFERFINTCDRLRGVIQCTNQVPGKCSKETGFESLLNSFRHFCIDQFPAFKSIFECLDLHSTEVLRECQVQCKATRRILGWLLYSFIHSALPFSVPEPDIPARINVQYFQKISSGACNMLSCYINCLQQKFNGRCSGIGGTMFLELLFRPLTSFHKSWAYSPIATSVILIMPQSCDFFTTLDQLNSFKLDEDTYNKISNGFSDSEKNEYTKYLQGGNSSATSWIPLLKSISSPLNHKEFSTDSTENLAPIHIEEIEQAIEEFKEIDRLQRLKL
uniref:CPG4 domain-containing protein n=1 Tax=Elaeophora elaphi TaxID=1147741 RepID=A0A0R3RH71_9BILA